MTGQEDKEGRVEEKDVGPVDNSALCGATGQVTSSLVEHVDCEFVPEDVWKLLVQWYVRYARDLESIRHASSITPRALVQPPIPSRAVHASNHVLCSRVYVVVYMRHACLDDKAVWFPVACSRNPLCWSL